jgi:dTDP-4-amino-4,6-dideoxygalactose transaminase
MDLNAAHEPIRLELRAAFERVLATGRFVSGDEVERFESALATRMGGGYAVGVASGTAALTLTLLAAGIGPGDEVIVPANTFFATAEAVVATGAEPVFADVEPSTALVDPGSVASHVTGRTAAVIAVHLYGAAAPMAALRSVAARHQLLLVEDAAQALGASRDGVPVGSLADAAAFSFFPTKVLGALGEGGAVTTRDAGLAERVRLLSSHGEVAKNVHVTFGYNERLDELQAALLSVKLARVDHDLLRRRALAARYRELLSQVDGVELLDVDVLASAHHLLVVTVADRDRVLADLRAARIGAGVHYPTPIHLQPAASHLGLGPGTLPHAEALARTVLSLPFYPELTRDQVERCVQTLARVVGQ